MCLGNWWRSLQHIASVWHRSCIDDFLGRVAAWLVNHTAHYYRPCVWLTFLLGREALVRLTRRTWSTFAHESSISFLSRQPGSSIASRRHIKKFYIHLIIIYSIIKPHKVVTDTKASSAFLNSHARSVPSTVDQHVTHIVLVVSNDEHSILFILELSLCSFW